MSCLDPFDLPILDVEYQLVVDGAITTAPGPYAVRLYRVRPLHQDLYDYVVERGCHITIEDSEGNAEKLTEVGDGRYETSPQGIRGVVGRSYRITITTTRGWSYTSTFETIHPVGAIEAVRHRIESGPFVDGQSTYRIQLSVDALGVPGHLDRIRFRRVGTYQLQTEPKDRTMSTGGTSIPDPLPCSGYAVINGILTRIGECKCCICWITETEKTPVVFNESLTRPDKFSNIDLGSFVATATTLQFGYHLEIQALSVTDEAYQFWSLIRAQDYRGLPALFQPAPATVRGNITAIDNSPPAMGYFSASALSSMTLRIEPSEVPGILISPRILPVSCTIFDGSSNQKPPFWPE